MGFTAVLGALDVGLLGHGLVDLEDMRVEDAYWVTMGHHGSQRMILVVND